MHGEDGRGIPPASPKVYALAGRQKSPSSTTKADASADGTSIQRGSANGGNVHLPFAELKGTRGSRATSQGMPVHR